MRELRLIAVSDDGAHLILAGHDGEQLVLPVDDRLHAAIRGDRARLGQLDIRLEGQLRPRDIQARIRAGESLDAVAAVAGMPRDKVERFAGPVIAEREHIASRARQATVRRLGGDGPPQTLEAAATATAHAHGADPELIQWDAWRREDGRWLVRFSWDADDSDSAMFSFDPAGRTVAPEDDNARELAGVPIPEPKVEAAAPPPTGPARLSVVDPPWIDVDERQRAEFDDRDDFGSDRPAIVAPAPVVPQLVRAPDPDADQHDDEAEPEHTTPIPTVSRRRRTRHGRPERRRREPELWSDQSADDFDDPAEGDDVESANVADDADDTATSERLRLSDIATHLEVEEHPHRLAPTADEQAPNPPRKSSAKSRRPSVPSWDEIMFGRRKNE